MSLNELGLTLVLVAVLLGVAGYFGRQQLQTLRGLAAPEAAPAERRYLRSQAYRRLFCSLLLVVFAGFLIGGLFLDERRLELEPPPGSTAEPSDEQREFGRLFFVYWAVAFVDLMVVLALASLDFWATMRHGLSQHRQLQADHRALLEEIAARRRHQRNGETNPRRPASED
jgi:hypothetical protein